MRLAAAETAFVKCAKILLCAIPFLVALSGQAQGGFGINYIWTNTAGGNWTGAANWTPNGVPGGNAGDTATIGIPGTYTVTLNSGVTISSLTLGVISGTQALSVTNPASLTVSGSVFIDTNGVLNFYGNALNLPTNSLVAGLFNWFGGNLGSNAPGGSLIMASNSTLKLLGSGTKTLFEPVISYGTTLWTNAGNFMFASSFGPPVTFTNQAGAVFDVHNNQILSFTAGTPPPTAGFYNNTGGLFRKTAGGANNSTLIQVPFHNAGTIQPVVGNLVFSDGLSLSSSSVLQFSIAGPTAGSQFGTMAATAPSPAFNSPPVRPTLGTPGSVQLAGTLNVSVTNYAPNLGTTFPLMTFGLKAGGFDSAVFWGVTNSEFLQIQVPTDRGRLLAVIATTNPSPLIVRTNLADQTVASGATVTFTAPASGVVPFTFQWQFDGTNLVGETNASLIINNVQTNNAGSYCVTVTDALLQANTRCASLSVFALQSFTSQPAGQTVTNGSTITLSTTVSNQLPVQYQWRRNGVNLSGATGPNFTVTTNAQAWDGGAYDVLVASSVGMLISSDAVVTVSSPALSFSNFPGGSISIFTNGSQTFSGSGNNANATNVPGEPDIEGNPPGHRLWVQWTPPFAFTNATVELDTAGSSCDTVLAVYAGSSLSNMTLLVSDDDSAGGLASRVFFQAGPGTNYLIGVDGFAGATGNIVLNGILTTAIGNLAQFNSDNQPQDQSVTAGGTATFSTSVSNAPNEIYQWLKSDWLKIPGATSPTFTISNVGPNDVDTYTVTTSSGTNGQSVDSSRATLEIGPSLSFRKWGLVTRAFTQSGGSFIPAFGFNLSGVSFPSVAAGTIGQQLINNFNSLTAQGDPASTNNGIGGSSRWYLLIAATNAAMRVDTVGSSVPTTLEIYTNFVNELFPPLIASDANSAPDGHSLVRYQAVSNAAYLVKVDSPAGVQGNNINLDWRMGIAPIPVTVPQVFVVSQGGTIPQLDAGQNADVTPPAYQWQCNGTNISGATGPTYQLSNIQFNQCGSYSVVVSNLMGVVTNAIALVMVDSPLKIASANPAHITGSAPQASVLVLTTNLAAPVWTPLHTNPTPLLPVDYFDPGSANRDKGFYWLRPWTQ